MEEATYDLQPISDLGLKQGTTLTDLQELANKMVYGVTSGWKNPLYALEEIRAMQKMLEFAAEKIEGDAIAEALKHNAPYLCDEIKVSQGRKMYDTSNTPYIVELKERVKELEKLAKSIKEKSYFTNAETGESVEVNPAQVSFGKESISFTFKK